MNEHTTLTKKGLEIAAYIKDRNLADAGRGWCVMGAQISPATGHATESPCYANCRPVLGICPEHGGIIDHGRVTEPGPVERHNLPPGVGPFDVGDEVTFDHYGRTARAIVVVCRRSILMGGDSTLMVYRMDDNGDGAQHTFPFIGARGYLTKIGRGDMTAARAHYRAHLAKYPVWQARIDAGEEICGW